MNLQLLPTDTNSQDLHGIDLSIEIKIFCNNINLKKKCSLECFEILSMTYNFFPNISIALRIMLTMSITRASGKRNFSKLKIIKNSMVKKRLSDLSF